MTFEEKLIEAAEDAIAAEIKQAVPSQQIIDYPRKQCESLGRFGANEDYSLYHWTDEKNQLYAIQRNGVTLAWMAPESAEKLADLISEDIAEKEEGDSDSH